MALKPLACQSRDLVQRPGLLKEVRRPGNNHQLLFAAELRQCRAIQFDDLEVVATNDQQGRRSDTGQSRTRQIRTTAPRNDSPDLFRSLGRRH